VPPDTKALYRALLARDRRFDGLFFVGVTSTGVYCRPICPVKPPMEINCRFYSSAPEAEQAGFRPCLRCRPELAPGQAPVDDSQRIAQLVVQRIEEGQAAETSALEVIAGEFQLSSRQLRRIIYKELGVAPIHGFASAGTGACAMSTLISRTNALVLGSITWMRRLPRSAT